MKKVIVSAALALAVLSLAMPSLAKGNEYRITITNLTSDQIISPPLVASHSSETRVFEAGQPASDELALLAEDGDPSELADLLAADPEVLEVVVADGGVMPFSSRSVDIQIKGQYNRLSLAGMLVTTNDAFVALDGLIIDKKNKSLRVMAPAYDAGSEFNSELCAFIPGPPCGNGGVRNTAGAEGYVTISSGIHGIGDLLPEDFDWHNPVALVTIERK